MKYGERLKRLREDKKISQQQLADKLNINRSTYARYELSQTQPDFDVLKSIADFYEVTIDYLLGRTSENSQKDYYIKKFAEEFPDIDLMFEDMKSFTAEDMRDLYDYVKFKKSQREE